MTQIDIKDIECSECRMAAQLDENAHCEFCRREAAQPEPFIRRHRDRFVLMAALVVGAIVIIVFGIAVGRN